MYHILDVLTIDKLTLVKNITNIQKSLENQASPQGIALAASGALL